MSGPPRELRAGQAQPHTVEFWGGTAGWSGEDANGFSTGPATGATLLFHIGIPVQVGLDLGFARMDSDQLVQEVDEFYACMAARYRLGFVPYVRPFLGIHGGYTRLSAEYEILRFEQNGWLTGASAGFEVPMGSRVMLFGAGTISYYGYRDTTIFLYDVPLESTGGNAWRYGLRLGLSFRWGR